MKDYLKAIGKFIWLVLHQTVAYIGGTAVSTAILVYERYWHKDVPLDAITWGIVAFILVACFLAWKKERDKNLEPESTHAQLEPLSVGRFVVLLQEANKLVGDASSPTLHRDNWQSKVVQWFQKAEAIVQKELPENESIRFNTISPRPIIGQSVGDTVNCLNQRRNKLWAMVGRLMPDDWASRRN